MSFSRKEIYEISGLRAALKFFIFYSKFTLHIDKKVKKFMDKIMLTMDNFLVHVASKVNEFRIKSWNKILTIVPYFPNLNQIKKVTLSIKSKTSSYLSEGKRFKIKMFQNSIYNTAVWDLSGFIKENDKEVIQKMRDINKILVEIFKIKVDKQLNQFSYLETNFEMFLINRHINITLTFLIIKFSRFILDTKVNNSFSNIDFKHYKSN